MKKNNGKIVSDHLGKTFNSVTQMCDFYGIQESTYYKRLKRGYSLKDTLIGKHNKD